MIGFGVYLLTIAFIIGSFYYSHLAFFNPQLWVDRMNDKCGNPPLFATFEYVGLYYGQQPAKFLGCFIGLHFRSYYFKHANKINKHWFSFSVRLVLGFIFQ